MRVDIEGGKYTYVFEDGRARLLRHGEPSRRDVVGDKVIYCMAAEIAELRQQLAAAQAEAMTFEEWYGTEDFEYDSELASAAWTKGAASRDAEVAELRDQLNTFHSAVEHVTEDGCTRRSFVAMPEGWAMVHKDRLHALELAEEQLAATDGLDQYILCEKEPVVWMQSDHLSRFVHHACGAQSALVRCSDHQLMPDFQPLYRAKEPKP